MTNKLRLWWKLDENAPESSGSMLTKVTKDLIKKWHMKVRSTRDKVEAQNWQSLSTTDNLVIIIWELNIDIIKELYKER